MTKFDISDSFWHELAFVCIVILTFGMSILCGYTCSICEQLKLDEKRIEQLESIIENSDSTYVAKF